MKRPSEPGCRRQRGGAAPKDVDRKSAIAQDMNDLAENIGRTDGSPGSINDLARARNSDEIECGQVPHQSDGKIGAEHFHVIVRKNENLTTAARDSAIVAFGQRHCVGDCDELPLVRAKERLANTSIRRHRACRGLYCKQSAKSFPAPRGMILFVCKASRIVERNCIQKTWQWRK